MKESQKNSAEEALHFEIKALKKELRDLRKEFSLIRQKQSDLALKDVRLRIKELYIEHLQERLKEGNKQSGSKRLVV